MKRLIILFLLLVACAQQAAMDVSEAARLGKPIKCLYQVQDQNSVISMKGSQMRIDTMPADAHAIYTEDRMYSWQGSQGMVIKMSDLNRLAAEQDTQFQAPTSEVVLRKAGEANARCSPADVPESMFIAPSDVKFEDLGEAIKQVEAMAKGTQKSPKI